MITTVFRVKLIANTQDGVSTDQPDADFDEAAGYSVGFVLLVTDGTTWICDDATNTAAVWSQDLTNDPEITEAIRKLTELIPLYCFNDFADPRYYVRANNMIFSGSTLTVVGAGFDDSFFVGDTLWVDDSRRNDGPYDVTAITADEITVDPVFPQDMTDVRSVLLYAAVYMNALQDLAARMAWYDVYIRPTRTPGLNSESVGSYSYSKDLDIAGIAYPLEIAGGLSLYKRPRVI